MGNMTDAGANVPSVGVNKSQSSPCTGLYTNSRKASGYVQAVDYTRRHQQPIPIWRLKPALRVMLSLTDFEVEEGLLRNPVNSQVLQVSGVGYFSVRNLEQLILLDHYEGTQITESQEGEV